MLFPIVQKLRGADYGTFCGPDTDLCIEGYQSSANSFIYNVFRILRPDLKIAHHTHSVANVQRALSRRIPTLIVFRDPAEAVPSMAARFRPSLEASVHRYVRFYRFPPLHSGSLILANFEEVTEWFEETVRRVQKRTELSFGEFDLWQTVEHIREWSKKYGSEAQMSLPRSERQERKDWLRHRPRESPQFRMATTLHSRPLRAVNSDEKVLHPYFDFH